ncbi:MAG TPA: phosphoglucosamine mutase [Candidatus Limnocylindria bacterium]
MGRLFGTDGIRGAVGSEVTADLALALGRAVGQRFGGRPLSVVLGRDTRRSGEMLSAALAAGLTSTGTDVLDLGVVTTPCLVDASSSHAAGIMVSASHNPAPDNGLKVVVDGRKADDDAETELERLIADASSVPSRGNAGLGRIRADAARIEASIEAYRRRLVEAAGTAFTGLRLAIDCANGSASAIAPELFRSLGAEVTVLFASPDGTNINQGCGSTHPERLAQTVAEAGLDLGLAFDGDADRLIAADERGRLVDGDAIMGICALARLADGTLRNSALVVTVMSNGGLERAVRDAGGRMIRTAVGDRNVLEAMEREDATLGGEQSGHIIFRDRSTTGDGLLTAIELVRAVRHEREPLSTLADRIPRLPQVVINSVARRRDDWRDDRDFAAAVDRATAQIGERGRILVRPSGTERKIRIMVEGDDADEIERIARELATLAEARLNR